MKGTAGRIASIEEIKSAESIAYILTSAPSIRRHTSLAWYVLVPVGASAPYHSRIVSRTRLMQTHGLRRVSMLAVTVVDVSAYLLASARV